MMTIQQTRNAQIVIRQAIIITNHGVMKIENVVRMVNTAWDNAGQAYPLPYGEYKRRAWLLADLTRMQQQLADQLRDLEFAAGLPVDEETGVDLREHSGNSIAADHAEALAMVDAYLLADKTGFSVEACKAEIDAEEGDYFAAMVRLIAIVEAAHAEALEVNKVFDFAVKVACCHADLDSVTHSAINNAIDHVRHDLLEMNRYNNRFIVKMMASVAVRAKTARAAAKVRHQEMLERCAKATDDQISKEIPF